MSHVQRLLTTDRIFFVTANLRRAEAPLADDEFPRVAAAIDESRRRRRFLLCGYVLYAWEKQQVSRCPIPIDYVRLPLGYHG